MLAVAEAKEAQASEALVSSSLGTSGSFRTFSTSIISPIPLGCRSIVCRTSPHISCMPRKPSKCIFAASPGPYPSRRHGTSLST
jgi:hypothetical protein